MDDLNKKRLENGQRLSFHGNTEDELNDMLTEACRAKGYNGRSLTSPRENPIGDYRLSTWQPFGAFPEYEAPAEVAKLMGYTLVATERDDDGWFHLYFDADQDRGLCHRRVDIWEGDVGGSLRSDILDDGIVDPLSEFTPVIGEALTGVAAFRSGRFAFRFQSGEVERQWDCPLDAEQKPPNPVRYEKGRANFERVLIATR